ncbi:MAG TPA: energy transducer TonB [Opitutaceae bacterium]|nr:energy transducer TonB [Opitutaceae bacterium]
MKLLLTLVAAAAAALSVSAQGYNPGYSVRISVSFSSVEGRTPMEENLTPPAYPFEMRRAGMAGEVDMMFTVLKDGSVADVKITRSSHREFEEPVRAAVRGWRFRALPDNAGAPPRPNPCRGSIKFELVDH